MNLRSLCRSVSAACLIATFDAAGAITADAGSSSTLQRRGICAVTTLANGEAELLIYGYVGDWYGELTAERIVEQLNAITATTINVRINSDGGVVTDGIAIYNALRRHAARKVVTVDGIAASIASLVAMSGDEIVMAANTMMMVHAPSGGTWGNAANHRDFANVLDTYAAAMLESYARRMPDKRAEMQAILAGSADHWFTATQAVEFGLADRVLDDDAPQRDDEAAAASLLAYVTAISNAPAAFGAGLRRRIQAAVRPTVFASLDEAAQRAVVAHIEDPNMRDQYDRLITANAGGAPVVAHVTAAAPSAAPAPAQPAAPPAPAAPQPTAAAPTDPIVALEQRNAQLRGVFATFRHVTGVATLEADCLADPRMTIEAAQTRLLAHVGAGGQPLNGGFRVEAGNDERDRIRAAGTQLILARAGVLSAADAHAARQGNPFGGHATLMAIAEHCLIAAGINTRSMDRETLARTVLAVQTTSDFPILLETALHRMLLSAYALTAFTWRRFCRVGSLSDLRPHNRYHLSSFSDLQEVNEAGEYENGVLGDAAKEQITGKRKGRILQVTPDVIINDDLGGLQLITAALGQAAGRTVEKDVYALLALNAGLGPVMSDGKTLFHADHGNIATTPAAPSVESFDAARQQMGQQKDPGGNDYLDIVPDVWLGPQSVSGKAREVNAAEYNDESNKQQRRPNISRNMFRDLVDSPRLSGTAWYAFASLNAEAVVEVAFLDGQQEPRIAQETNFRTEGLSWRVTHPYGVAGVGYRGAVRNAGA